MKLELKHLAPYLPYGLKAIDVQTNEVRLVTLLHFTYDLQTVGHNHLIYEGLMLWKHKPILIPLSAYKNKIIKDTKDELELSHNQTMEFLGFMDGEIKLENISYGLYISLCKFHIDFNKLIEKGLAIDVNTLVA